MPQEFYPAFYVQHFLSTFSFPMSEEITLNCQKKGQSRAFLQTVCLFFPINCQNRVLLIKEGKIHETNKQTTNNREKEKTKAKTKSHKGPQITCYLAIICLFIVLIAKTPPLPKSITPLHQLVYDESKRFPLF